MRPTLCVVCRLAAWEGGTGQSRSKCFAGRDVRPRQSSVRAINYLLLPVPLSLSTRSQKKRDNNKRKLKTSRSVWTWTFLQLCFIAELLLWGQIWPASSAARHFRCYCSAVLKAAKTCHSLYQCTKAFDVTAATQVRQKYSWWARQGPSIIYSCERWAAAGSKASCVFLTQFLWQQRYFFYVRLQGDYKPTVTWLESDSPLFLSSSQHCLDFFWVSTYFVCVGDEGRRAGEAGGAEGARECECLSVKNV